MDYGSVLDVFWGYLTLMPRFFHKDVNLGANQTEKEGAYGLVLEEEERIINRLLCSTKSNTCDL